MAYIVMAYIVMAFIVYLGDPVLCIDMRTDMCADMCTCNPEPTPTRRSIAHLLTLTCSHACMFASLDAYILTCLEPYMLTCLEPYILTCLEPYMFTCLHAYMLTPPAFTYVHF